MRKQGLGFSSWGNVENSLALYPKHRLTNTENTRSGYGTLSCAYPGGRSDGEKLTLSNLPNPIGNSQSRPHIFSFSLAWLGQTDLVPRSPEPYLHLSY